VHGSRSDFDSRSDFRMKPSDWRFHFFETTGGGSANVAHSSSHSLFGRVDLKFEMNFNTEFRHAKNFFYLDLVSTTILTARLGIPKRTNLFYGILGEK